MRIAVSPCPSKLQNWWPCRLFTETLTLTMQVAVVRYLVGGPSVLTAEDLARQDDAIAGKTDGVMLSSDMVQRAHRNLVNVIRDSGCSKVHRLCATLPRRCDLDRSFLLVYLECLKVSQDIVWVPL